MVGEAVGNRSQGRRLEHQGQVNDCMASHGERQLGLVRAGVFHGDDQQGARIQDARDGRQPRLIIVLRAIVTQHREGQMAFEQFGRPAFPFRQERIDGLEAARLRQPQQDLRGTGG